MSTKKNKKESPFCSLQKSNYNRVIIITCDVRMTSTTISYSISKGNDDRGISSLNIRLRHNTHYGRRLMERHWDLLYTPSQYIVILCTEMGCIKPSLVSLRLETLVGILLVFSFYNKNIIT